jgi:hypothetical protein
MATDTYQPPDTVNGLQRLGMGAALVGVVLSIIGTVMAGQEKFYQAYLVAYVFWMGIVLGSMALLMVQHLTGGAWGVVIRRPLEAAARTMPLMAFLFIPIVLGMNHLYHWAQPEALSDPVIAQKAAYLNTPFFLARQVFYFAVWVTLSWRLTGWSAAQDKNPDPALLKKFSVLSGGGLLVYALTSTFAAIDWTMSVNPHWFSTMWGPLYMAGQGLSAFAFSIVIVVTLSQVAPLNRVVTAHHLHDLGKFLFAFLMMWAYLSFSQFLIIWSANLEEEIPHYLVRWDDWFGYISAFIIVGHFVLPYALLLSRDVKRDGRRLRMVAIWILFARVVDYYWHVAPEFHGEHLTVSLLDIGLPLAIGGIFLGFFASYLRREALLPVNDPGLPKALAHHVH